MITSGGGEESSVPPRRSGRARYAAAWTGCPSDGGGWSSSGRSPDSSARATWGLVLLHWLVDDGPVNWTAPLPGLLGGFIGTAGVVCLQRRSLGATLTRGQLDRALRDGRLPEDADAELWALVLGDELADLRASLTAGLATMVVLAASATGLALIVDPAWAGMSLTAVVLAVGGPAVLDRTPT
jgi:hypothetical protein